MLATGPHAPWMRRDRREAPPLRAAAASLQFGHMDDGVPTSDARIEENEVRRAAKGVALGWLLGTVLALLARSSSDRG